MSGEHRSSNLALPPEAAPATAIVQRLRDAGFEALLAGGCVRDLLRGAVPDDYDVATAARPEDVCRLFRPTRRVGAAFGVVLVRQDGAWVEVATFRSDGAYADGRHPAAVTFTDARQDAARRDFTINGMFLNPLTSELLDYVQGEADLRAGIIRTIGTAEARFREDHLRLLRGVRFAARFGFVIEAATRAAIRANASLLRRVAAERVHDELRRMFAAPSRAQALALLGELGLLERVWEKPVADAEHVAALTRLAAALPPDAPAECVFALLLAHLHPGEIEARARELCFSTAQLRVVSWLARHQADLDDPWRPALADFKRLLADPAFAALAALARARAALRGDAAAHASALGARVDSIPPERVAPPAFVNGDDLAQRGVPAGPIYKRLLDELFRAQLSDELQSREQALARLDELLREARDTRTG